MTVVNFNYPKFKYTIPSTGQPGVGYKLFTYEEGTSIKKTTWTSLAKTAANTNPIILDANGECDVWIDGDYKFVLAPPTDTDPPASAIWTYDAIRSSGDGVSATTGTSLPINGSFEDDIDADGVPDNWTVVAYSGGTVTIDSTTSTHGAKSLKFTSSGSGGGQASTTDYYEVEAGKVTGVRFSIISANANTFNKVQVYWYNAAQVFLSSNDAYSDATTNPTSWTRQYTTVTAPATAKYARIVITGVDPTSTTHSSTTFDSFELDTGLTGSLTGPLTATAAELNVLDGITASTAELNILDGVTASTAELNILDGVTASTAEINVLDGIPATLTAIELGYVDGVTSAIQTQFTNTNTTSNILSLTAAATLDAIGTYVFAYSAAGATAGSTYAGSTLTCSDSSGTSGGTGLSGTWRAMGGAGVSSVATLYLRIS